MVGSTGRVAAEIVAPGEEPLFFDDIGCLRTYLAGTPSLARGSRAFVVDHRTGSWIEAGDALYTENAGVDTPMNSHLLAHESIGSRNADPEAGAATPRPASDVFKGVPLPDGAV